MSSKSFKSLSILANTLISLLFVSLILSITSLCVFANETETVVTTPVVENISVNDKYYQEYLNQYLEQYRKQYEEQYLKQYTALINGTQNSELTETEEENSIYNNEDSLVNSIQCTSEEREMLYYIVEVEAHGGSHRHKNIITSVIVNRMLEPLFNYSSLKEVMTDNGQFTSLGNYYSHWSGFTPTEDTKRAVDEVLDGVVDISVANNAVYFYNPSVCGRMSFFESKTVALELEGHKFFKVR